MSLGQACPVSSSPIKGFRWCGWSCLDGRDSDCPEPPDLTGEILVIAHWSRCMSCRCTGLRGNQYLGSSLFGMSHGHLLSRLSCCWPCYLGYRRSCPNP
jgi:hypothetical protein